MSFPTESQWARYSALCAHLRPLPPSARQAQLAVWQAAGAADPQVLSLVALHYALPPDPDRDRTGERLGSCTLEAPLGVGGMGIVYRAQQQLGLTTRPVAVKLIHPALLRTAREEALVRFQAEMSALVHLEHESIARIYDGGIGEDPHTHEPLPYIAMEFVRGGLPLTTYAQDAALAWPERLQLFLRVCRAVQYAHEHRIVHRDLKPANILVDREGRPFVIDFGLASACDALLPGGHLASGTPAYMSPEQVSDAWGAVSDKSDVYALGLILYELLTEQPPYALPPQGAWEQLCDVVTTAIPRPLGQHRPEYQGELEALVAHALAKRPADRCSVAVLRSRLERFVQAQPARLARVEGERKQVTVLCADMQGYTPLAETLGEEVVYDLMNQVYERLITVVYQEGGTVQELTGDGMLALFGAPVALENAPLHACRAALTMQTQLRSVGVEVEAKHGVHPKMRIGIHTGPVVVGTVGTDRRMEYKAVGDTVHLAARLESLATPGSILLSEATSRLVEGYVQSPCVGEREVNGKRVPQRVYRLEGLTAGMARFDIARQRGLTPFIGRERELERLEHHCDAVRQDGLHLVHVIGEAGMGKSRLIHEFHQRLRATPVLFLQGHCTAAGRTTSFLPFLAVVRRLLGLGEGEDPQEVTRKIRHGLEDLGMPPDTSLPLLLALLGLESAGEALRGLDGEIIGARTRAVLQGLLLQRCRSTPVVVCLEDLHWLDTASEALLRQIMQSEARVPLLLLCSSRPPYQLPWAGRPHVTALPLAPLSGESTLTLVKQCLGTDALPEEFARLIGEKTEGNPLFAEEITRYLLERGILRRIHGRIAWQPVGQGVQMPATLQDLVLARVDGLAEAPRTLLQVAAVIGHRFPVDLLRTIYGGHDDTFAQCLQELEAHALLARQATEDRVTYHFTHVLIQDTLYRTLLTPRREARTACAQLLALGAEARDPRTTAMGLWVSAFVDVFEERFEEAIARAEGAWRLSPDPLDRLTAQGVKGMALALWGQGQEGYAILHEVRQELVAGAYLFPLTGIDIPYGAAMVLTGQMAAGVRWIEKAIQRFGALGAATQHPFGHLILGEIYLQMALGQAKPPLRVLQQNLGFVLRTLPRAARKAQYHLDEAIRRARALEMPGILARALLDLSLLYQARKRMAEARGALAEARDLTERWASPPLQAKIGAALASLEALSSC